MDLMIPLGDWILRTACAQCKAWRVQRTTLLRMAVNLSGCQLRQHDFVEHLASIVREAGLETSALELDISERVLMEDGNVIRATLRELKQLGFQIAIDDYGTGYLALSDLKQCPVDRLKLDRTFVRGIDSDHKDRKIASAIMALADSMDFKVTAEGVEQPGQLKFLREHHCNEAQGFYLSRPLPAAEVTRFLSR